MSKDNSFSWSRFDSASIEAFARASGYTGPNDQAARVDYLSRQFSQPTLDFVEKAFYAIQQSWLRRNEQVAAGVVAALIRNGVGPREKPLTANDRIRFLSQCTNRNVFRRYFQKALLKYGTVGKWSDDSEFVIDTVIPQLSILKPSQQSGTVRDPYDYQRRAWDELNLNLSLAESTGRLEGFLVMPTGSGKTFTSARWLMENHINRKGRVLWLAHRYELLEQAAQAFASCAGLAKDIEELRIRIVSGCHCPAAAIRDEDQILCCSVQSMARNPEVVAELIADPSLFLVVDEAHHASAKSYRDIIEQFRRQPRFKLLGLTATPTRTLTHEQPLLSRLFGNKRIFEIETRELIEKGFLSRPIPVTVRTESDVEEGLTPEDYAHLRSFNELSEAWKNRIAHLAERNEVITRHYLQHRDRYGKTLVFAINIPHAELLTQRLRQAGVATDYVASTRLNGESYNKRELIDRFRDPSSGLDILINVMILTEGVDIPNIKTVFLARPVQSEILLRQMVGRALRGPAAGGTKEAYLVNFKDSWREFEEWERPLDMIQDIVELEDPEDELEDSNEPSVPKLKSLAEVIPWDLIRRTAQEISTLVRYGEISSFEAVPHGWYILEQQDDEDLLRFLVPLYQHQESCWNALFADLENGRIEDSTDLEWLREEYFHDCDAPRPASHDLDRVVAFVRREGRRPEFQLLSGRDECDPVKVAAVIWEDQLGPMETDRLLRRRHEVPLAKAIYSTFQEFRDAVQREVNDLANRKAGIRPRLGTVEFEPWGSTLLAAGPHHDVARILEKVLEKGATLPDLPRLPWNGSIQWTRRPIKGWYGKATWNEKTDKGSGEIRINCLLDSPDVSESTLEYLVWHEYLHLFLQAGHTPVFRKLEKMWPGSRKSEQELETLSERFDFLFYW
jgi:superfamily II DNA or RNA helicase